MTNAERLKKLELAVSLIREVEFSYEEGTPDRTRWYSWVSSNCSFLGLWGSRS